MRVLGIAAAAVLDDNAAEGAVGRIAHGALDAHVGRDAAEEQRVHAVDAQHELERGRVEAACAELVEDALVPGRLDEVVDLVLAQALAVARRPADLADVQRQVGEVLDLGAVGEMDDAHAVRPAEVKQALGVRQHDVLDAREAVLGVLELPLLGEQQPEAVVARAGRVLQVDDDEAGRCRIERRLGRQDGDVVVGRVDLRGDAVALGVVVGGHRMTTVALRVRLPP